MTAKQTIGILFTRPRSVWRPWAWIVRAFLWAPYSHVGLRVGKYFVEVLNDGLQWTPMSALRRKAEVIAEFEVEVPREALGESLAGLKARPYDWGAIAGLVVAKVYALAGCPLPANPLKAGPERIFCSEAVYLTLRACGVVPRIADPDLLDPKKLLRLLECCVGVRRLT